MSIVDGLRHRLRALFRPAAFKRDVDEELKFHLALDSIQREHAGLMTDEARLAARRRLGNPTVINEERRMTTRGLVDVFRQDLRYAWRALLRSPLFAAVAVASIALGVGANTTVFSLLYSTLLQRLPLPNADQLVSPAIVDGYGGGDLFHIREFAMLRDTAQLSDLAAYTSAGLSVMSDESQRYVGVQEVSGNYFSVLRLRAERGRLLTAADEHPAAAVVVVGFTFWQSALSSAPDAVGRVIRINGAPFTIVGVTPREFSGVRFPDTFDMAIPLASTPLAGLPAFDSLNVATLNLIGRLHPGIPAGLAARALDLRYQHVRQALGDLVNQKKGGVRGSERHLTLLDASRGVPTRKMDVRGQYRRLLFILMGGVSVVLLIACANVASLLLARAMARRRELAVRLAVGASRRRVVAQLLTESVLLALIGGAAAFLLAWWATSALVRQLPEDTGHVLSGVVRFKPNAILLGFTALISIGTGMLFGVLPALRGSRLDLAPTLQESARQVVGKSTRRLGSALIAMQIALSCLLLVSAALFVRSLQSLRQVDMGFERSHVLVALIDPRGTHYAQQPLLPVYERILTRARQLPGAQSAGLASFTPILGGSRAQIPVRVAGYEPAPDERLVVQFNGVSPGFLRTMRIPLVTGRDFSDGDRSGSTLVAIVSQRFADRFFHGKDPIGQSIWFADDGAVSASPPLQVVGVARDAKYDGPRSDAPLMVYVPFSQDAFFTRYLSLSIRTASDPDALAAAVRSEVERLAPGIRLTRLSSLEQQLDTTLAQERFAAALASVFGSIALLLACVGLYGLMAYQVVRRTTEIGIRMALGARRLDVLWMVLRDTLLLVGGGSLLGLGLALAGTRVLRNQLFGVVPSDPVSLLAAVGLLAAIGVCAGLVPARRASRIDPVRAMRTD